MITTTTTIETIGEGTSSYIQTLLNIEEVGKIKITVMAKCVEQSQ